MTVYLMQLQIRSVDQQIQVLLVNRQKQKETKEFSDSHIWKKILGAEFKK